ncbi:MAG: 16S rRNA processing protein RimM [Calditrichaceae bacterium]|nr:16S rRNA processing protein RimM [Calditrichaceae bacterium]MBN2709177.1 16S rRNA processing protein RimM [Calditrichaceae bacterium]RQV96133.1 MAG: 16S rRNA processing protein RimM [Calditrichota bacterium]
MYIVGKILKPQGIKGELKVEIITSFPDHFTGLKELFVKRDNHWQTCLVENIRIEGRFAYIRFLDVESRNDAEKLRGQFLYIPAEKLKELKEDEYYIHDLIDLEVFDDAGVRLGKIIGVENYQSNDAYVLETETGESYLIPAVKDFIREINLSSKKMIINRINGLID